MITSNIAGLGRVLTDLQERIKKLENARPVRVIGGTNVRTTQNGMDWIVNAEEGGGGGNIEGYSEFNTLFCVNGSGVVKTILTKTPSSGSS